MDQKKSGGYGKVFLIALITAILVFLPAVIYDYGYFIFVGDFNSQQIPFYKTVHDAIRSGNFGWNWYTDLGVNMIGSYSFYLIGSPFFWLTIPFPSDIVPYLMAPLLVLKFACASVTGYAYLKRQVRHQEFAMLGALLYAFSGYSIYNIFFNHFHEAMVFFPLLLIGLDELMDHGTKGVFALAVFVNAVVSYFFFVGEVVFVVVYFFVKVFCKGYQLTVKKFFSVVLEAVIGFVMSMFLFLPSLFVMLSNSRVNNYPDGFDIWTYSNRLKLPAILSSFLFPAELPSKPVFFADASIKWTSLSAYLPLFSVTGVLAFMRSHRSNWLTRLLTVLLIMALVPGLNSLFVAFNKAFYARWFYMFTLMLSLATIRVLDEQQSLMLEKSIIKVILITTLVIIAIGLTPDKVDGVWRIGLYDKECLWQYIVISVTALVSLGVLLLLSEKLMEDPAAFARRAIAIVCIISVLYGNFYIVWGKLRGYDTHDYFIPDALEGQVELEDDGKFYRIDADDSLINIGMFWKIPGIRAFHSLVPASIMEYYDYVGEERAVNSKPETDNYGIRGLLSVRYYVDAKNLGSDFQTSEEDESGSVIYGTEMPGYSYHSEQCDYSIYENEYYVPMGFTYDQYITVEELRALNAKDRALIMMESIVLSEEDEKTYGALFEHKPDPFKYELTEDQYFINCRNRAASAAASFSWDNKGFSSTAYADRETLVFFSVPFEEGWSAYVNGTPVDIVQANIGFMAVPVTKGSNTIEFRYQTPLLKEGSILSAGGVLVFVLYLLINWILKKRSSL